MTSFKELISLFPGKNKAVITVHVKDKKVWIENTDGSAALMVDPIQVQDMVVPEGKGKAFMDAVRAVEPTASKSTYFDRNLLSYILEKI